jgi:uncharacterized protein YciI
MQLMREHRDYRTKFTEEGSVIVFGPVADPKGTWGVAILEVDDEAAARSMAENDPVTKSGSGFRWDTIWMPAAITRK